MSDELPKSKEPARGATYQFMYRNHEDKFEAREVIDVEFWYGQSQHYSEHKDTWFLRGTCTNRNGKRDFMISRIIGMYAWSWLTYAFHPLGHGSLATAAEMALEGLYVESGANVGPTATADEAFTAVMAHLRELKQHRENTMLVDVTGAMIHVGDVVRAAVGVNDEFHGSWADYTVEKAPGGYRLSYFISEKGQRLPVGYTAGYLSDTFMEKEDRSMKDMVFSQVPLQSKRLTIVTDKYR